MTPASQGTQSIKEIFSEIPARYDLINHVLTIGLDIYWRRRAAEIAAKANPGHWADICTGTGAMASCLAGMAPKNTHITGLDFSPAMMAQARMKPQIMHLDFITADATALPFLQESLDLVTMSFATRNINTSRDNLIRTFAEFHRVLKNHGRFVSLETSQPRNPLLMKLFHLYIGLFVRQAGNTISGTSRGYAYLAGTISTFYPAEQLAEILREAGFRNVSFKRLTLGAVAVHTAVKE